MTDMEESDLKGKKVTVMGLGLHGGGVGTVAFLSRLGAQVTVTDLRSAGELKESLSKLEGASGIRYSLGGHRVEDFEGADMVVKNPGIPWGNEFIKNAERSGAKIEMDSSLFFKLCKGKIIGVTGTKGKTTVSSLIFEILKAAGRDALKVGIGQVSVLDKLDEIDADTLVVFELSSWRLSALGRCKTSPSVAVITNIYPDHLNYYGDMEAYVADKKNIFIFQNESDICVMNADNPECLGMLKEIPSNAFVFSKDGQSGMRGSHIEDGEIVFRDDSGSRAIMDSDEIRIKGAHNIHNVLAAVSAACAMGIDSESIRKGVSNFSGNPHRLEFVREIGGVKYYNDSAATTPESAIAGLKSFSEPVVMICGGSDKNLDMSRFSKEISRHAKHVVFLKGTATDKMLSILDRQKSFSIAESMTEAVDLVREETVSGDIVLLSPGAASFGMFLNEFDRGDKFREAVNGLKDKNS